MIYPMVSFSVTMSDP